MSDAGAGKRAAVVQGSNEGQSRQQGVARAHTPRLSVRGGQEHLAVPQRTALCRPTPVGQARCILLGGGSACRRRSSSAGGRLLLLLGGALSCSLGSQALDGGHSHALAPTHVLPGLASGGGGGWEWGRVDVGGGTRSEDLKPVTTRTLQLLTLCMLRLSRSARHTAELHLNPLPNPIWWWGGQAGGQTAMGVCV